MGPKKKGKGKKAAPPPLNVKPWVYDPNEEKKLGVQTAMFVFEVVVESVQSMVDSRALVIRSDFADIFSLELRDPKSMHIQMPEPLPLPPEPVGKKGKKKPKPKKPKKGKKGKVEPPPPEPIIQSGQSVLFTSNPGFLIQNMKKYSLEVSLWNKEDTLVFIGSNAIPWDPLFIFQCERIAANQQVDPTILRDSYNIFEEGTAKIMAKLALMIKLSYLGGKVSTAFRTLSEDPVVKKVMYTGLNNKEMSYICNYKTTDEDFENNCNKIENKYIIDKMKGAKKINYADYKNAPGANLGFFDDGDYCCMGNADKPPDSKYKAPETCPDINFIIDYVRKIITSCNDNMRMLTPRPALTPRIKATDIDRLCYCRETEWPEGEFAERFKKEAVVEPCPLCIEAGKRVEGPGQWFDVANIRGPCGRFDCRIARDMRAYIETLAEEDNQPFVLDDLVGPCGSKTCTLAEKITEFIRHEGVFTKPATVEGLSTQCACVETMRKALERKESCESKCSKDCEHADSDSTTCGGKVCPFNDKKKRVYQVYYFTVEFDNVSSPGASTTKDDKVKRCSSECAYNKETKPTCSQTTCSTAPSKIATITDYSKASSKCHTPVCPSVGEFPPSPADSNVVINFNDIHAPCCVQSCDVAAKVKDFIEDVVINKENRKALVLDDEDPCFCDCVCDFRSMRRTTYCAVCGGYEHLGEDMADQPSYIKPHPCPVYHKLYDRKIIRTPKIWPGDDEQTPPKPQPALSAKQAKSVHSEDSKKSVTADKKKAEKKEEPNQVAKKSEKKQKKINKYTVNVAPVVARVMKIPPTKTYPYPAVPKNMGWNWTAEDIPGLKPRANWKPGAANRILVRRYRALREGQDVIAKKKRAMMQRKKKIEAKPTIVVTKKNGEYTVQMEVFKKYSKERLISQYPYEDKPPLIYTIGRTEAENRKLKSQRDRRERRETRRKSRLLQSTFRDKCQEICLKAYNQAMGVLPLPNPNDPDCPCSTAPDPSIPPPIDSCSCSDEETISSSDTDDDEWVVEFTAPIAKYDGKAKNPPVLVDGETQYTYLDYKVKVLDKSGNQVPRFFKGIDGKELCSDLGGFWGPGHIWQEINKDGFIGPDNRWVPMNFIGPDGMFYTAEEGFFTDANGQTLKLGIDGYINKDGKWAYYSNRRVGSSGKNTNTTSTLKPTKPKELSSLKGTEKPAAKDPIGKKKAPAIEKKLDDATKLKSTTKIGKGKTTFVLNTAVNSHYDRNKTGGIAYADRIKIDANKIAKYKEIMQGLQEYEDFYDLRPLMKTNRATQNTTAHIRNEMGSKKYNTIQAKLDTGLGKSDTPPSNKIPAKCESSESKYDVVQNRYGARSKFDATLATYDTSHMSDISGPYCEVHRPLAPMRAMKQDCYRSSTSSQTYSRGL